MADALRSIWIWLSAGFLILLWLPIIAVTRLFDRDPVRYRTGLMFRRLGRAITSANPLWTLNISGYTVTDPRRPYIVVCNHQSLADVPLISNLKWEMKWLTKKELFDLPVIGWMLRMSGDIEVDRNNKRAAAHAFILAAKCLSQHCSVIFFPEGTRSADGRVHRFNDGAFRLAMRSNVAILPLAVEGSYACLPKKSWKFGMPKEIMLKILPPVEPERYASFESAERLRDEVRDMIVRQIAAWRGVDPEAVDVLRGPDTA
jgi:1-acyl-sn-glycerol-3-phosphate acyltransferase